MKKGVEIQLNPSNLGSKQSFYIELQLPILIMLFHLIFFKKLQRILCTACLNTDFVGSTNTINIYTKKKVKHPLILKHKKLH
jgi:hypothetical protein